MRERVASESCRISRAFYEICIHVHYLVDASKPIISMWSGVTQPYSSDLNKLKKQALPKISLQNLGRKYPCDHKPSQT